MHGFVRGRPRVCAAYDVKDFGCGIDKGLELKTSFWPSCGYHLLDVNADGHLVVTDDFLRALLERPELAPIEESCPAERELHARLLDGPRESVEEAALARLADADTAENYRVWFRFRVRLLAMPTLEASYLALFKGVDVPPLLVDHLTQDRKSTRLNSSHVRTSRMPSSA